MTQNKTRALSPIDDIRGNLTRMEGQFKAALPENITPQKFTRVAMTAIQKNPDLLRVDRRSLYGELISCATDGLIPDGREAVINVYGQTASYQPMIGGIMKKARNSGLIKTIDAIVVYEKDDYESWVDEKGPHFKFVRNRGDRGGVLLTFAYAITNDGGFFMEEIDEVQMSAIEAKSRAKVGPWKSSFKDEMRRKSALRRLAKYRLPSSADLDDVIRRDDDAFDLNKGDDVPKKDPPKDTSSRLRDIIDVPESTNENTSSTAQAPQASQPESGAPEAGKEPPQEEPPI